MLELTSPYACQDCSSVPVCKAALQSWQCSFTHRHKSEYSLSQHKPWPGQRHSHFSLSTSTCASYSHIDQLTTAALLRRWKPAGSAGTAAAEPHARSAAAEPPARSPDQPRSSRRDRSLDSADRAQDRADKAEKGDRGEEKRRHRGEGKHKSKSKKDKEKSKRRKSSKSKAKRRTCAPCQ